MNSKSAKSSYKMRPAQAVMLLCSFSFLLVLFPASSAARVTFDFEGPVFIEHGTKVKDHSLFLWDGLFHLYYTRGDAENFGHATSEDLEHWTIHEPLLSTGPGDWDSFQLWAPCVIRFLPYPRLFLMYYTGVNNYMAQRTCMAYGMDLYRWNKAPTDMFTPFHGDTSWIEWNETGFSHYRDPCFFGEDGTFYIAHTARTKSGLGAIALAESDDYFQWRDAGPLYVHDSWHSLESPFLMKRGGKYHIFFTEEYVGGISHMSSDSLTSGWDIIKRAIIDDGAACELLDIGSDLYLFSRHTSYSSPSEITVSSIRFDTLSWNQDMPEVQIAGTMGREWTILWGTAFDHQPVFGDNPLYRGSDTTDVGFEGNWWIGTCESFNGPLMGKYPGSYQGDEPRGAVRSTTFTITGRSMRLLVGGGRYPDSCYVALCDAGDGEIILRETGRNTDSMSERIWDLDPFRGRAVYILIVDDSSAPFGHINVDGIEERPHPVIPSPDDVEIEPLPEKKIKKRKYEASGPAGGASVPAQIQKITGHPNPFNPETEIRVSGVPKSLLSVVIYNVSGGEINRLEVTTDESGAGFVNWNGRDRSGKPVPSGIYPAVLRDGRSILAACKLVIVR